jgi:hypothetical protein
VLVLLVAAATWSLAGGFAACLVAVATTSLQIGTPAAFGYSDLTLIATLFLTLAWWRSGNWLLGIAAGGSSASGLGLQPDLVHLLWLPLVAAVCGWSMRKPLVSFVRVTMPATGWTMVAAGLLLWLHDPRDARFVAAGWWLELSRSPAPVPAAEAALLAAAITGWLMVASRSIRAAFLLLLGAAIVWWSRGVVVMWPILLIASSGIVGGTATASRGIVSRLLLPWLAGLATALLVFGLVRNQPEVSPVDLERLEFARTVAEMASDQPVAAPLDDAGLRALLVHHDVEVVETDPAFVITSPLLQRRHLRELGFDAGRIDSVLKQQIDGRPVVLLRTP